MKFRIATINPTVAERLLAEFPTLACMLTIHVGDNEKDGDVDGLLVDQAETAGHLEAQSGGGWEIRNAYAQAPGG